MPDNSDKKPEPKPSGVRPPPKPPLRTAVSSLVVTFRVICYLSPVLLLATDYWGFVLWPVVALLFYVLSSGPALLAADKGVISWRVLDVYSPLGPAYQRTTYGKPIRMYLRLWVPEAFDKNGDPVERYWQ